jgi:hypothetical protein
MITGKLPLHLEVGNRIIRLAVINRYTQMEIEFCGIRIGLDGFFSAAKVTLLPTAKRPGNGYGSGNRQTQGYARQTSTIAQRTTWRLISCNAWWP